MEIEFTKLAESSLIDIAMYITENFSQIVAKRSVDSILQKIRILAEFQGIGQPMHGQLEGLRCLRCKQNQIFYCVIDGRVQIIIVWDGRQDPNRLLDLIIDFLCDNKGLSDNK